MKLFSSLLFAVSIFGASISLAGTELNCTGTVKEFDGAGHSRDLGADQYKVTLVSDRQVNVTHANNEDVELRRSLKPNEYTAQVRQPAYLTEYSLKLDADASTKTYQIEYHSEDISGLGDFDGSLTFVGICR